MIDTSIESGAIPVVRSEPEDIVFWDERIHGVELGVSTFCIHFYPSDHIVVVVRVEFSCISWIYICEFLMESFVSVRYPEFF